jgi:uncharacterized protein
MPASLPHPHFHLFRNYVAVTENAAPAAGRVISGAPQFTVINRYESADGKRFCGEWHSTQGAWNVSYDEWEYCHILSGKAIIHPHGGDSWEISAGDSFVLEPGFTGSWTVTEPLKKLYTIIL